MFTIKHAVTNKTWRRGPVSSKHVSFTVFILWSSPNHTPIQSNPIKSNIGVESKKRNQTTPTHRPYPLLRATSKWCWPPTHKPDHQYDQSMPESESGFGCAGIAVLVGEKGQTYVGGENVQVPMLQYLPQYLPPPTEPFWSRLTYAFFPNTHPMPGVTPPAAPKVPKADTAWIS